MAEIDTTAFSMLESAAAEGSLSLAQYVLSCMNLKLRDLQLLHGPPQQQQVANSLCVCLKRV